MPKRTKQPENAKYPSVQRKCKFCGITFTTKPTYNGSKMKFCSATHRKAFDKEGEKPIERILRRQDRHIRKIAREEIETSEFLRIVQAELHDINERIERIWNVMRPAENRATSATDSAR